MADLQDPSYAFQVSKRIDNHGRSTTRGRTYHFNVTWPFCTRFILKPTVGIELSPSAPPHDRPRTINLLYRELASLNNNDTPSAPPKRREMHRKLTARTLNNDVLPAFCRPIMVMSISVALEHAIDSCQQPSE